MKITDSQIIEKIRNGIDTIEKLACSCGITMACGGCYSSVEKIIKNEKSHRPTDGILIEKSK